MREFPSQCIQVYDFVLDVTLHGAHFKGATAKATIAYLRDHAADAFDGPDDRPAVHVGF